MSELVFWLFSTGLCGSAFLASLLYLVMSYRAKTQSPRRRVIGGDRPWRRLGAAICALISVMFYAGVNYLDYARFPRTFAAYWMIILALVVWLCGLAVWDMMYTRRVTREILNRNPGHR